MELIANFMSGDLDPAGWARRREDEGWDALGCADHFYSPNRGYPHLWVTLATFAAATSRVMLTSSFANNLFRTPVEFALLGRGRPEKHEAKTQAAIDAENACMGPS